MLMLEPCTAATSTAVAMVLGWVVGLSALSPKRRVNPEPLRLAGFVVLQLLMVYGAYHYVPGCTHILFVIPIVAVHAFTPWVLTRIGTFESVTESQLGNAYITYLNIMFTVSVIGVVDLLVQDPSRYMSTVIMQVCIAASLYFTGVPAILHRQQKLLITRKQWKRDADDFERAR